MKLKDFFFFFYFQVEGPRHQSPDRGHRWRHLTLASTVAWEIVFYRTIDLSEPRLQKLSNQSIHHKAAWLHTNTHISHRDLTDSHTQHEQPLLSYCTVYDSFVTALIIFVKIQYVEETKIEFNGQCIYTSVHKPLDGI